nr:hypothetical protein [Tanacetum cinerariifolium]
MSLPLIQDRRGRQIIPKDYFINKDLEYLKGGDSSRCYSTFVTKTKATSYDLKWIKDMVYDLWCPITRLKIKRKYDYSYLEEIEVRRDDQQIYTFKEGDFSRLHLQDIEEMLLFLTQQRLANLIVDERYDLNVAVHMFIRCIVIQRRVEDLQLGDGISADEEIESVRQEEGSGYGLEYRQTAVSKEGNAQFREVCWWQTLWGRPSAARKDHMIYHMLFSSFGSILRDLPRDILLDSVEVLMYDKRSKTEIKGKVPTEMELVLEQTQQGTCHEVLVSAEGVEESKRNVRIKGVKKEALYTLKAEPGSIHMLSETLRCCLVLKIAVIYPVMQCTTLS